MIARYSDPKICIFLFCFSEEILAFLENLRAIEVDISARERIKETSTKKGKKGPQLMQNKTLGEANKVTV